VAFVTGLDVESGVGAALMLLAAVTTVVLSRRGGRPAPLRRSGRSG
jgi:hypothetical protein